MGSKQLEGITFHVYSNDHVPRHVHAFYQGTEVVIELAVNGKVYLANRKYAIRPKNAKISVVRKLLRTAANHVAELNALWESIHE